MSPPASPYNPIPPLHRTVRLLTGLSDKQFAVFEREVRGPHAFDTDATRVRELATALELQDTADASILLAGCRILYDRARDLGADDSDVNDAARDILQFSGLWNQSADNNDLALERLSRIIRRNSARDLELKRHWLRTGILDVPVGFSSFVDLRPNYNNTRSEITELLPVIIFSVLLKVDDGGDSTCVFQLSERSFRRLEHAIKDVRRKLSALRSLQWPSPLLAEMSRRRGRLMTDTSELADYEDQMEWHRPTRDPFRTGRVVRTGGVPKSCVIVKRRFLVIDPKFLTSGSYRRTAFKSQFATSSGAKPERLRVSKAMT